MNMMILKVLMRISIWSINGVIGLIFDFLFIFRFDMYKNTRDELFSLLNDFTTTSENYARIIIMGVQDYIADY